MAQRCVRLSESTEDQIQNAIRTYGHASIAAFLRTAIQNELRRRHAAGPQVEREIAATLDHHRRELKALTAAVQAQFALIDAFARMMLHCIPEPSAEVHASAVAQARQRHQKLLRMAAINMRGETKSAIAELVRHGE